MTPIARTLAKLRSTGWLADVVEGWQRHGTVWKRRDYLGIGDVFAIKTSCALLIQVTTGSNASARVRKLEKSTMAREWLEAGGHLQVWAWSKSGKRGKRKLWNCRVIHFTLINGKVQDD